MDVPLYGVWPGEYFVCPNDTTFLFSVQNPPTTQFFTPSQIPCTRFVSMFDFPNTNRNEHFTVLHITMCRNFQILYQ